MCAHGATAGAADHAGARADTQRALAAERGTPWFASPEAMLATMTPDGAIIATPNVLHVPGALACLEAGIPVLVEKPLGVSVASAQRLVEAQAHTGIPVLAGHHQGRIAGQQLLERKDHHRHEEQCRHDLRDAVGKEVQHGPTRFPADAAIT